MKVNFIIVILLLPLLLVGCNKISHEMSNEVSIETANTPEEALKNIEVVKQEREINIYGSHKVNEELVLFIFSGVMNDTDVWYADVYKEGTQWKIEKVLQMNGPFEGKGNIQTVISNDEFGYEVGYIVSENAELNDLIIIEIERIKDWKIWIKQSQ